MSRTTYSRPALEYTKPAHESDDATARHKSSQRKSETLPSKSFNTRWNPNIYVDASGTGIGIAIGPELQWLAWTYRVLPSNQDDAIFNIVLAELIALELGIRAAATMGLTGPVLLLSDNTSVVKAMSARQRAWSSPGRKLFGHVMRRINELCAVYGLDPTVAWVCTNCNHADGPSRGTFENVGTRAKWAPALPQELRKVLQLVPATCSDYQSTSVGTKARAQPDRTWTIDKCDSRLKYRRLSTAVRTREENSIKPLLCFQFSQCSKWSTYSTC